jgi:hypothetical protein
MTGCVFGHCNHDARKGFCKGWHNFPKPPKESSKVAKDPIKVAQAQDEYNNWAKVTGRDLKSLSEVKHGKVCGCHWLDDQRSFNEAFQRWDILTNPLTGRRYVPCVSYKDGICVVDDTVNNKRPPPKSRSNPVSPQKAEVKKYELTNLCNQLYYRWMIRSCM